MLALDTDGLHQQRMSPPPLTKPPRPSNRDLLTMSSAALESPLRMSGSEPFQLERGFVESFRNVTPPFGFNGLGELVYVRTYSRTKPDGTKERWFETVERVVNGTYTMQKQWVEGSQITWKSIKAQRSAQEMYRRVFALKFVPPGRGLWAMGSPLTEERKVYATLNNCAFVSTEDLVKDAVRPFVFLVDASMLGIGVGFDVRGAGVTLVIGPSIGEFRRYVIADSREGWVDSVVQLLRAYFYGEAMVSFDYSLVRPAGAPIRGFGGISCGPLVLEKLHDSIRSSLDRRIGEKLSARDITDIMNQIGVCVVSGNLRRTAELSLGPATDEFMDLKNYKVNPERAEFGWASNNSIFAEAGMDYDDVARRVCSNGEPGFVWLDNMRYYGRMNGTEDRRDHRVMGGNPCLEQSLESFELCCLVETFPHHHESRSERSCRERVSSPV